MVWLSVISATNPELDITLDLFGKRPVPVFTQISFCFAIPDGYRVEDISRILTKGAERLAEHFPWVAGQVVCEGATESSTGLFKIKPLETIPRVWEALQQSSFPMNILDETTIIKGGLVLTFLGQHQAMDGTGQAQVISLFSQACGNKAFTQEELKIGNLAPENRPELEYNIIKQEASQPGPGRIQDPIAMDSGVWSYFNFSASALRELKLHATQTLPLNTSYSIARARLAHFSPTTEMLFARAVDLRRYLGIAKTHPGFVQNMTYHSFSMEQTVNSPLGITAANLRAAVDPQTSNLTYHGRSLATMISRTPDKRTISFLAGCDTARDVMLSSWANQNSYQLDFGLELGSHRAVRRPRFDSLPGLAYFMPKTPEGDIGVAISLSAGDTEVLRADSEFLKHAVHIG
ncbi:putative trichothecene 3-O-acetyltransferase [Xylaria digitata]|nr:putative trichothecene 3-O-acetyltransferase [Xylaria digitata]